MQDVFLLVKVVTLLALLADPYFGGAKGFELVLDLLEDAAEGLLSEIASS